MSNANEKQGGLPKGALIAIGVVLMLAGVYISSNVKIPIFESLTQKGLPVDPGETIATIGVLMILFPVVESFFIVPLRGAIEERNNNLARTFAEVEELRDEMTRMKSDYEGRLTETESNAREQIQAQIREAQVLKQTLQAEATQRSEQLLEQARLQIEQEKANALLEIRTTVVDLTLAATEKLIGETMNDERSRRLINDFITSVEAQP